MPVAAAANHVGTADLWKADSGKADCTLRLINWCQASIEYNVDSSRKNMLEDDLVRELLVTGEWSECGLEGCRRGSDIQAVYSLIWIPPLHKKTEILASLAIMYGQGGKTFVACLCRV